MGRADRTPLARAITTVRKRQSMTQEQVEALTGIPQVTLSRWENGAQPALDDLVRLEDGLGVARGAILREAGYVAAEPRTVGEVIDYDPTLTERFRALVWSIYREAQALSADLGQRGATPSKKGSPNRPEPAG